jgi:phosphopantetheinyl transferase (holo-ACP synthase)
MAEVGSPVGLRVINQWSTQADAESMQRPDQLLARALLRGLLVSSLSSPASQWQFAKASCGKPLVTSCGGEKSPSVSISHSGSWSACAVSYDGDVGIDIETMRADRDCLGIAMHAFGPLEYDEVAREGGSRFYAIWTMREAIAKAVGIGLEMAADGKDRVFGGAQEHFRQVSIDAESWQIMQRKLSNGLSLGLALRGPAASPSLRWWVGEPLKAAL